MYLSKITMSYKMALSKHLNNPYCLHQWIWTCFDVPANKKRDFLFRYDLLGENVRILILSLITPKVESYAKIETTEFSNSFLEYKKYKFQIKVNPVFRRNSDHRRVALYDESKLIEWITIKFEKIGLIVEQVEVSQPQKMIFNKHQKKITIVSVDMKGVVSVANIDKFKCGFSVGVGSAKGFGLGMLMLQPVI